MLRLRDKQTRDRRDVKGSMEKLIKLAISEIYRVITLWRGSIRFRIRVRDGVKI